MIGTGILWFGWFGFNAGSALAANGQAAQAFMNTFLAAAAAGLAWLVVEWLRDGHPTTLGAASGIVAGLVAITPAAGYVSGVGPLVIGAIAGVVCCYAVRLKAKFGYDDALDVVGVHFVGGLVGSLLIGFFANPDFFGSRRRTPSARACSTAAGSRCSASRRSPTAAAIVWSFVLTFGIMIVLKKTIGVRVERGGRGHRTRPRPARETGYHSNVLG